MFDFDWTEIALIGVVALIAIGPKDLPVAIKTVAGFVKKARKMAGEFQGHVDEMVREANLTEVRDQFNELRRMDIKGQIEKAVDSDGELRKTLSENPMQPGYTTPPVGEALVESRVEHSIDTETKPPAIEPPAFIPPSAEIFVSVPHVTPTMPAFVPPGTEPASQHTA
jgi:sec-independent protein translocase protein TatB